jgi:coproporphyrinogen III oxidase-like Fe-S oxidoreductase
VPGEADPLALYVHWPAGLADGGRLVDALVLACERQLGPERDDARLGSVLIGGEMPLPEPPTLSHLLARLPASCGAEISLEVDPTQVGADELDGYRTASVDRLVIRAGMLDDAAADLVTTARAVFDRVALDLTFGRAGQTARRFAAELDRAVALGVRHLSLAEATPDDPELGAEHYLLALRWLRRHGLMPYDIAHFARAGQESRHHLHGAEGGAVLGIGPGAVGRLELGGHWWALHQMEDGAAWLAAIEAGGDGLDERRRLTADERVEEVLTSGLRLREGVARRWFEPLAGGRLEDILPPTVNDLIGDGFVELDRGGLRLTDRGWPLCDAVLLRLLS